MESSTIRVGIASWDTAGAVGASGGAGAAEDEIGALAGDGAGAGACCDRLGELPDPPKIFRNGAPTDGGGAVRSAEAARSQIIQIASHTTDTAAARTTRQTIQKIAKTLPLKSVA